MCTYFDGYLSGCEQRSVQENWDLFQNKVNELTDAHVPIKFICSNLGAPWFNNMLKRLCNKTKRLLRTAKLCNTSDRWEVYRKAELEYNSAVCEAKKHFITATLPSLLSTDPKKFWNDVNPEKRQYNFLTE